jgi:hypothetical protein
MIRLTAGLAVVLLSFWITTGITQRWSTLGHAGANLIHIAEATYGKSCRGSGHPDRAKPGNATVAASQTCDNTSVICPVIVDSIRIGDPAPGCSKDFSVSWRCGRDQAVHEIYLPEDATNKIAWVSCEAT